MLRRSTLTLSRRLQGHPLPCNLTPRLAYDWPSIPALHKTLLGDAEHKVLVVRGAKIEVRCATNRTLHKRCYGGILLHTQRRYAVMVRNTSAGWSAVSRSASMSIFLYRSTPNHPTNDDGLWIPAWISDAGAASPPFTSRRWCVAAHAASINKASNERSVVLTFVA